MCVIRRVARFVDKTEENAGLELRTSCVFANGSSTRKRAVAKSVQAVKGSSRESMKKYLAATPENQQSCEARVRARIQIILEHQAKLALIHLLLCSYCSRDACPEFCPELSSRKAPGTHQFGDAVTLRAREVLQRTAVLRM